MCNTKIQSSTNQDRGGLAVKKSVPDVGLNLNSAKNPDPSNWLSPRFDPCPIFMSCNDGTNIRRLYISKASNAA